MNDTPKNVRQVGDVDVAHKIYVEDYVITYTKGIGENTTIYMKFSKLKCNNI